MLKSELLRARTVNLVAEYRVRGERAATSADPHLQGQATAWKDAAAELTRALVDAGVPVDEIESAVRIAGRIF